MTSNCQDRRPSASNFGRDVGTNSFIWDHLGTKPPGFMAEISGVSGVRTIESSRFMEQATGIEPKPEPWEALNIPIACFSAPFREAFV
jgi:hypothetical protein